MLVTISVLFAYIESDSRHAYFVVHDIFIFGCFLADISSVVLSFIIFIKSGHLSAVAAIAASLTSFSRDPPIIAYNDVATNCGPSVATCGAGAADATARSIDNNILPLSSVTFNADGLVIQLYVTNSAAVNLPKSCQPQGDKNHDKKKANDKPHKMVKVNRTMFTMRKLRDVQQFPR